MFRLYYVLNLLTENIFLKTALRIGSWGWIGGAKKEYDEAVLPLKWDEVESYEWQGLPSESDKASLKERGRELAKRIKA